MDKKIMYLCDGEVPSCEKTHCYKNTDNCPCTRTSDIAHAINFENIKGEYYREKEKGKTLQEEWNEERSAIPKTHGMAEQDLTELP